jgi:hypothetical protein
MATNTNPYNSWQTLRQNSDYRSRETQSQALVRQQLSQPEFLSETNRVNPGPKQVTRTKMADSSSQVPHVLSPEDMWGWQNWANKPALTTSSVSPQLKEQTQSTEIPGGSYYPNQKVGGMSYTGCSSCRRRRY